MSYGKFYTDIVCFVISIGGLLLGISANVSGASIYFGDYFGLVPGSFSEGLAVGITMLATFIGNFFAGNICDGIGRKRALILAAVLFSFCTIGSALSRSYAFLQGRDYVVPEDVQRLFLDTLAHRMIPVTGGQESSAAALKERRQG